ncbi:unnamed protein product [Rhodiola kirilowii]
MSEPMNGGDGSYSYAKNSEFQGMGFDIAKTLIETSISKNLDVKNIIVTTTATSDTFYLADLGCSTGPNTFAAMQSLITSISQKHKSQNSKTSLEFQVFFNDLPTNDFNTLISTLPSPRSYFAAAVPGSFYGRLFPSSSLQFVYASHAIHWLSKIPDECLDRNSKAWNKGRVHYAGGCEAVVEAHAAQFGRDMDKFLKARGEEIVSGGMLVLISIGCPDDRPHICLANSLLFELLGSVLLDMAKRGLVDEDKVDSFNLPVYAVKPKEIQAAVERNGSFKLETMDLHGFASTMIRTPTLTKWKMNHSHMRAGFEPLIANHFGQGIIDDLFELFFQKIMDNVKQLEESNMDKNQLLVVLTRL